MPLININDAAALSGISRSSLERCEARGLIAFIRISGRVFVDLHDLCSANILTIGKAARLLSRSWRTAKRWIDAGYLKFYHEPFPGAKRRTSIDAIFQAKNQVRSSGGTARKGR